MSEPVARKRTIIGFVVKLVFAMVFGFLAGCVVSLVSTPPGPTFSFFYPLLFLVGLGGYYSFLEAKLVFGKKAE